MFIPKIDFREANLSVDDAEHFINFDYATEGQSEYRIEYQIIFKDNPNPGDKQTALEWFTDNCGVDPSKVIATDPENRLDKEISTTLNGDTATQYTRVIPVGSDITKDDIAIMKGIFSVASDDNHVRFCASKKQVKPTKFLTSAKKVIVEMQARVWYTDVRNGFMEGIAAACP